MELLFEQFGNLLIQNIWISILVAFIAGVISSFSPCSIASIPLIIGYIGGYNGDEKNKPIIYSLLFSLGLALTLTILGILSAILGKLFLGLGTFFYLILGVIMLIVSLQLFGILKFKSNVCKVQKKRKGFIGAFLLGILGGVFLTPCSTPVLIAILAFVAEKGNILLGAILLFIYSIGHSALVVISGISLGFTKSFVNSNKTSKIAMIVKYIFAIIILLFGLYMIYLGF